MSKALERLPEGARVVVIRLRSMGDCILTTPALEMLKEARPDLHVSVVVEDRFAAIFEGNPDIDTIVPPEMKAVARLGADLCLNLHGGTRSLMLTAASRARLRAGFAHLRSWGVYNVRIPSAQEILGITRKVHTAEHIASAIVYLGARHRPPGRARLFANLPRQSPPYAILHPVAATRGKTWPARKFLYLAEQLKNRQELEPVFIGAAGELSSFRNYRCLEGMPLRDAKQYIQGASLFIGNDSGPAHMAAAFGVSSVVLFGDSDAEIWAPWQAPAETLIARNGSIESIEPDEVLAAAEKLRVAHE